MTPRPPAPSPAPPPYRYPDMGRAEWGRRIAAVAARWPYADPDPALLRGLWRGDRVLYRALMFRIRLGDALATEHPNLRALRAADLAPDWAPPDRPLPAVPGARPSGPTPRRDRPPSTPREGRRACGGVTLLAGACVSVWDA